MQTWPDILREYLPPLTITLVNALLPTLFEIIAKFESLSADTEIEITIARFLKFSNYKIMLEICKFLSGNIFNSAKLFCLKVNSFKLNDLILYLYLIYYIIIHAPVNKMISII